MKTVFIIGNEIENKHLHGSNPNLTIIRRDNEVNLSLLPKDTEVVVIHAHGDVAYRGTDNESAYMPLSEDKQFTIDTILAINEQVKPNHYVVVGCNQGALVHDIKRNLDKFASNTSFYIPSSSKHSLMELGVVKSVENIIDIYCKDKDVDHAKLFAKQIVLNPETLNFVKILQNPITEKNEMIILKISSPKNVEELKDLENYFINNSIFNKDESTSDQHQALQKIIKDELVHNIESTDAFKYNDVYIQRAACIAAQRGKLELFKAWFEKIEMNYLKSEALEISLQLSALNNHEDIVKFLLDQYNVNIKQGLIPHLISNEDVKENILCLILAKLSQREVNEIIKDAVSKGDVATLKFLLSQDIDITVADLMGNDIYKSTNEDIVKFVQDNQKALKPLHLSKLKVEDITDKMMFEIIEKSEDENLDIILAKNIDINKFKRVNDCSLLHDACSIANLSMIKKLLDNGADVNAINNFGATAMHYSIDNLSVIKLMLEYGGNLHQPDFVGRTLATQIVMSDKDDTKIETLKFLLSQNITKKHLEFLIKMADDDQIKNLIINVKTNDHALSGENSFVYYDAKKFMNIHFGTTKYTNKKDELYFHLNNSNEKGHTALHFAVAYDDYTMTKFLLETAGFAANIVDHQGRSPLYFALANKNIEAAKIILSHTKRIEDDMYDENNILKQAAQLPDKNIFKIIATKVISSGSGEGIRQSIKLASDKDFELFKYIADAVINEGYKYMIEEFITNETNVELTNYCAGLLHNSQSSYPDIGNDSDAYSVAHLGETPLEQDYSSALD